MQPTAVSHRHVSINMNLKHTLYKSFYMAFEYFVNQDWNILQDGFGDNLSV